MAAACVSSPFCTWFLAACMFMGREKDLGQKSCKFQSPKGQNRRRKLASKCTGNGGPASLYGTGIQNFMSSCLSCKPCEEYSGSNWFPSSLSFFDDDASSICGSKPSPLNRRRRRKHGSASISVTDNTGNAIPLQPKREDTMQKKLQAVEQPEREETIKKKSQDEKRRVVVTGLGVLTSIGQDADTFYSNLLDGTSGISEIEAFDCSRFPTKIAGEIKSFSAEGWVLPKLCKRMDKFMLYLLTAGKKALADGGITELVNKELDKARCGVIIGSSLGGLKVFTDAIEALRVSYRKMNPFCIPFSTTNMGSALLAIDLGWMGPNYSISSACATSNFCILNAANSIMRGETEVMLCGGTDAAIVPIGLAGFVACRTLSNRNGDPTRASRPWDTERDGFVLGEGAGVLLLEELQHAKRRGAKIYAEFLGGSFTCDAYHMTEPHPDGKGIALCMEQALANSGVAREDVNYINAHATSTQTGDLTEYQALVRCFGKNPEIRINSTKSMIGHLLGASGAVEAVATVKAIQTGWIHPNINLENPDKAVDMNLLVDAKKERLDIKVFPLPSIPTSLDNSATNSCNPKQRRETPSTMHEPWAIGSPDLRFGPKEEKDNS